MTAATAQRRGNEEHGDNQSRMGRQGAGAAEGGAWPVRRPRDAGRRQGATGGRGCAAALRRRSADWQPARARMGRCRASQADVGGVERRLPHDPRTGRPRLRGRAARPPESLGAPGTVLQRRRLPRPGHSSWPRTAPSSCAATRTRWRRPSGSGCAPPCARPAASAGSTRPRGPDRTCRTNARPVWWCSMSITRIIGTRAPRRRRRPPPSWRTGGPRRGSTATRSSSWPRTSRASRTWTRRSGGAWPGNRFSTSGSCSISHRIR